MEKEHKNKVENHHNRGYTQFDALNMSRTLTLWKDFKTNKIIAQKWIKEK